MPQESRVSARGFRIFWEGDGVKVVESSLAFEGAHVRIYGGHDGGDHVQLSYKQAKHVVDGLQEFIREAEEDRLTEGIFPPDWPDDQDMIKTWEDGNAEDGSIE